MIFHRLTSYHRCRTLAQRAGVRGLDHTEHTLRRLSQKRDLNDKGRVQLEQARAIETAQANDEVVKLAREGRFDEMLVAADRRDAKLKALTAGDNQRRREYDATTSNLVNAEIIQLAARIEDDALAQKIKRLKEHNPALTDEQAREDRSRRAARED